LRPTVLPYWFTHYTLPLPALRTLPHIYAHVPGVTLHCALELPVHGLGLPSWLGLLHDTYTPRSWFTVAPRAHARLLLPCLHCTRFVLHTFGCCSCARCPAFGLPGLRAVTLFYAHCYTPQLVTRFARCYVYAVWFVGCVDCWFSCALTLQLDAVILRRGWLPAVGLPFTLHGCDGYGLTFLLC